MQRSGGVGVLIRQLSGPLNKTSQAPNVNGFWAQFQEELGLSGAASSSEWWPHGGRSSSRVSSPSLNNPQQTSGSLWIKRGERIPAGVRLLRNETISRRRCARLAECEREA